MNLSLSVPLNRALPQWETAQERTDEVREQEGNDTDSAPGIRKAPLITFLVLWIAWRLRVESDLPKFEP